MEKKIEQLTGYVPSGSKILMADFLSIGAELWLVAHWLETQDGQWRTPGIAIRVDVLVHQREGAHGTDVTVSDSIPREVLDGESSSAEGIEYQVIRGPSDHFGWIAVPKRN